MTKMIKLERELTRAAKRLKLASGNGEAWLKELRSQLKSEGGRV